MATGFKMATGEIIIQLDSDSYIVLSTVRDFIKPFVIYEVGAICAHADPENADVNLLTRMQAVGALPGDRIELRPEVTSFTIEG